MKGSGLRRYSELTDEERSALARWLRLRWACSGNELQAAGTLRLIETAEATLDGRLRDSAA